MDTGDPHAPPIVHACMPRDTTGYTIKETWDVLGMRATRSEDTVLEGRLCARAVHRPRGGNRRGGDRPVCAGHRCLRPSRLFGTIYYAIAQRAFDWTAEHVKKKTSLAMSRSMAYHAEVQHAIADMALELEAIGPQLDKIAQDWSDGVDHRPACGGPGSWRRSTGRSRGRGRWSRRRWTWRAGSGSSRSRAASDSSAMPDWGACTRPPPL